MLLMNELSFEQAGRTTSTDIARGRPRRGLKTISARTLGEALARAPMDHYLIWNGQAAYGQDQSVRARAMACIDEVGVPVSLRTVMQRAARIDGDMGLDPDLVRSAVRQHQCARPTVVFLVRRLASGEFIAVTDIPFAGDLAHRTKAGDLIMDRMGRLCVGAPAM